MQRSRSSPRIARLRRPPTARSQPSRSVEVFFVQGTRPLCVRGIRISYGSASMGSVTTRVRRMEGPQTPFSPKSQPTSVGKGDYQGQSTLTVCSTRWCRRRGKHGTSAVTIVEIRSPHSVLPAQSAVQIEKWSAHVKYVAS